MSGDDEEHHYGLGDPRAAGPEEEPSVVPAGGPSESQLTKQYGKGFSMLKKMGFKMGTGLGPSGEGITAPIEVSMRRKKEGLTEEELIEPKPSESLSLPVLQKNAKPQELSPIDIEKIELQREIENLTDKKRRIEYDIFSLSSTEESVSQDSSQIDELIRDLLTSQILSGNVSWDIFAKYVSILRDKYDCTSLWYELDIESVVTAAVAGMLRNRARIGDGDDPGSLLRLIREIVIDDDDFVRIVEFDILEKFFVNEQGLITEIDPLALIKSVTTDAHYASVFDRFTRVYLEELVKENIREAAGLLLEWFSVIPETSHRKHFIDAYVKPVLVTSTSPHQVIMWRDYLSPSEWQNEIVVRIAARILESLRRINPEEEDAYDLVHVAVGWSSVVPPLLLGFLLVECGFLARLCEHWKMHADVKNACRKWILLLSRVCYRSPAKAVLVEWIRGIKGGMTMDTIRRPSAPPRGIFRPGAARPVEGLSESALGKLTFGDVVREECEARNIPLIPRAGMRESGAQVYKLGERTVYWKDDALFEKRGEWVEVSLDSVLR